jgi:hypothetical protein
LILRRLEKSFDVGTESWGDKIHANTFQHFADIGAVVQGDGLIGVEDLLLAASTFGWTVKFNISVAVDDKLFECAIHDRACCVAVTVVNMHGDEEMMRGWCVDVGYRPFFECVGVAGTLSKSVL